MSFRLSNFITLFFYSTEKQNVTVVPQACELCNSLSLLNCVCKNQATDVAKPDVNYAEASSLLQNSVEATPLADLPGIKLFCTSTVYPELLVTVISLINR